MTAKASRVCENAAIFLVCCGLSARACGFAGGTGEPDDPYQIATPEHLASLGSDPNLLDKHFILTTDINLAPNLPAGQVFERAVIAPEVKDANDLFSAVPFTGRLDGRGHEIKGLTIRAGRGQFLGLFGAIGMGGRIHDVRLENALIATEADSRHMGLLAGYAQQCIITNCSATGKLVTGARAKSVGGLVGVVWFDGRIVQCSCACVILAGEASQELGGIAGSHGGQIKNCLATGSVLGGDACERVGGLVGCNRAASPVYEWSISPGHVTHSCSTTVIDCGYGSASLGGLVGEGSGSNTIASFWDVEASGLSESAGGVALTSVEMQDANTYIAAGWDLVGERANGTTELWFLAEGGDHPILAVLSPDYQPPRLPGEGTLEDPYRIATPDDLGAIAHHPYFACYRLMADLDLSGINWATAPLGVFDGCFEGDGFVIRGMRICGHQYLGLFDTIGRNACVTHIVVADANIVGDGGSTCIAGLAGKNHGRIVDCYVEGDLTGGDCLGGLVGVNRGTVADCGATGHILAVARAGGLAGLNAGRIARSYAEAQVAGVSNSLGGLTASNGGDICACYSRGQITGERLCGGGLVAANSGTVCDSYAAVDMVSRKFSIETGGLVGLNGGTVVNCHSVGSILNPAPDPSYEGGLIGLNSRGFATGAVVNSFWDVETSGSIVSDGGTALTSAEMQDPNTFLAAGWDFEDTWIICEGRTYPHLRWEDVECSE